MGAIVLHLLTVLLVKCVSGELDRVRLDEAGNFVDSKGNTLLFRGFNAVEKNPPWYPVQMLNKTQLKMFRDWGLNAVRLGVMWSGVMPDKHKVDEAYMRKIEEIIDACADYGIYLLLDMHQDQVSSRYGSYDGFPLWFVDEVCRAPESVAYPWPYEKPPVNDFENYFTYACADCATKLYTNVAGSWDYWAEFWVAVAKRFGKKTNVLGYELLNEPPPPNFYESLFSIVPGIAGRKYLLPVYDYVVEQIRKVDKETLLFYEPVTYGVFLPELGFNTGTGFDRVPNALKDPNAKKTSVLSYHYYCWPLQTSDTSLNMTTKLSAFCDLYLLPAVFMNSELAIQKTGGGRFLTEFGVCRPDGNPFSINTIECDAVLQMADSTFQSWTYWDTNFLDENGNPIVPQVQSFVRPYPQKTHGSPQDLKFDSHTGKFTYSFLYKGSNSSTDMHAALIYVPLAVHYRNGVEIRIDPGVIQHTLDDNQLRITVPTGFINQNLYITVRLSRKS